MSEEKKELHSWNLPKGMYQTLKCCLVKRYHSVGTLEKQYIHLVRRMETDNCYAVYGYGNERFPVFFEPPKKEFSYVIDWGPWGT